MIAQGQGGVCGSEREKSKHHTDRWPAMAGSSAGRIAGSNPQDAWQKERHSDSRAIGHRLSGWKGSTAVVLWFSWLSLVLGCFWWLGMFCAGLVDSVAHFEFGLGVGFEGGGGGGEKGGRAVGEWKRKRNKNRRRELEVEMEEKERHSRREVGVSQVENRVAL